MNWMVKLVFKNDEIVSDIKSEPLIADRYHFISNSEVNKAFV